MAHDFDKELVSIANFWATWQEWASQKPSLRHPIKYLKWYFSEPQYEEWLERKTTNEKD